MSVGRNLPETGKPRPVAGANASVAAYIERARERFSNSDLEIDDCPRVSVAGDGAWVAAWVWVAQEEAKLSS